MAQAQLAQLVFIGGSTFTEGTTTSRRGGVAVSDGRIIAVGSDEELADVIGEGTEVIDISGKLLLPGFQDSHMHPVMAGIELLQCNLTEAVDAEDCLRLIAEYAAENPDEEWILGGGWSMDFFAGGNPTRQMLDSVVPDRPVLLANRDHHGHWANSVTLDLAGITRETPDPADGRIEREPDGTPAGMLHEGAGDLVASIRPTANLDLAYRALLRAQTELLPLGITGWQDAAVGNALGMPDILSVYLQAASSGDLKARVSAALWWQRDQGIEQLTSIQARSSLAHESVATDHFDARTVKIMVDGVAENFTAAMSLPYLDACGHPTGNSGLSFINPESLKTYVSALDAAGFNVHFHALGDRAVSEALDAVEAARTANGSEQDRRHHLAHVQVVAATDVDRFSSLGATVNMQALWAHPDRQLTELTFPFIDDALIPQHYPFGDLQQAGAKLAAGSDWPVSSADPLLGIHVAVNRAIPGESDSLGSARQKLDLATAVTAYTAGTAYLNNRDHNTGRLDVGYLADLVVVDRDIFAAPPAEIGDASVESTWIGGVCVFDRASAS